MSFFGTFRPLTAAAALALAIVTVPSIDSRAAQSNLLATPWTELHGSSRVRLIAGPGKTKQGHYLAGLEISLAENWKTYWRMPGDSGVPPSFDWDKSANLAAAKPFYPAPVRMPEAGGTAVGYKRDVVLPIEITPKDPSKPVDLKLALEFGVCRDICIPVSVELSLTIPPGTAGPVPATIAAALERVPRAEGGQRANDPVLKRAFVAIDGAPKLVIEATFPGGSEDGDVFVEAPPGFYVPLAKRVAADGDVVRFESALGGELAQDLRGKPLTITLASPRGSTEVRWTMP